jgi:hypothetical protein
MIVSISWALQTLVFFDCFDGCGPCGAERVSVALSCHSEGGLTPRELRSQEKVDSPRSFARLKWREILAEFAYGVPPQARTGRRFGVHSALKQCNRLARCDREKYQSLQQQRCRFPFTCSNTEYPRLPRRRIACPRSSWAKHSGTRLDAISPRNENCFARGARMSKREGKRCIEGPGIHKQSAGRKTPAMNTIRSRAVARTTEDPILAETSGEAFAGGIMLDLVRDSDTDQIKLAHWDGSGISICTRVDLHGRTFVPPALHDDVVRMINLPSGVADYGSTAALFDDLRRLFREHPGLSEEGVSKAAFGALSSWFPECKPPLLLVSAPDASGSRLLLEQLRCTCRRSVIIGDVTRSGMWSLPLWLRPTIIIARPTPTKELLRVLHAMSQPGVRVPQRGQLLDVFCPVVVCTEDPLGDSWLLENSLQIELMAAATRFPRIAPQALRENLARFASKAAVVSLKEFWEDSAFRLRCATTRFPDERDRAGFRRLHRR